MAFGQFYFCCRNSAFVWLYIYISNRIIQLHGTFILNSEVSTTFSSLRSISSYFSIFFPHLFLHITSKRK